MSQSRIRVLIPLLLSVLLAACAGQPGATTSTTRTITDSAGRQVEVPATIDRVVTLGSVPVINSFLFALGKAETIVNGLPPFAQNPRWKYQTVFAPQLADQAVTQSATAEPDVETILRLDPDIVLTMSGDQAEPLTRAGLRVVVLEWKEAEDVKRVMELLGDVFGEPDRAQRYLDAFDGILARVRDGAAQVSESDRKTALFLTPSDLRGPLPITDWWINQAGGRSLTTDGRGEQEVVALDVEQILQWDPDVIFVAAYGDVQTLLDIEQLASLKAIRTNQVHAVPIAAHAWAHRTSEQPLTVLWASKVLIPDHVAALDLVAEVTSFYQTTFETSLTREQVQEILDVLR